MQLPTDQEIKSIHKKYAPTETVFDLVYTHCNIVRDVASQLITARGLDLDSELVRVGCLLHDIGVYKLFDTNGTEITELQYITHGIRGEEILKAEGFPEQIWRFASHHTGVGLTREEIIKRSLPLPAQDYKADNDEELMVMYADKFHSKTDPPYFNSFEWYRVYVRQFGDANVAKFDAMAEQFGKPDLQPLIKTYGHELRDLTQD